MVIADNLRRVILDGVIDRTVASVSALYNTIMNVVTRYYIEHQLRDDGGC